MATTATATISIVIEVSEFYLVVATSLAAIQSRGCGCLAFFGNISNTFFAGAPDLCCSIGCIFELFQTATSGNS